MKRVQNSIKSSLSRKVFTVFNYAFCIMIALLCLLPVVHILALSFSGKDAIYAGRVNFLPVDFTTTSYQYVMRNVQFFDSYRLTFVRVILGWAISLALTVTAAYPMAQRKKDFPLRPFFVAYYMGAMVFSGGMIPLYLVVKSLGLVNTIWALLLPCAVSVSNIILMMNFIKGLPDALSESASIDGAGHFRILISIVLPLCLPSLATISLFILLSHWNAWFDGMIYITNPRLKPLQTFLRSIMVDETLIAGDIDAIEANMTKDGVNSAMIFLAMIPVLIVYPFFQKYFAKGIVRGSVKE